MCSDPKSPMFRLAMAAVRYILRVLPAAQSGTANLDATTRKSSTGQRAVAACPGAAHKRAAPCGLVR
jgi:hypothetical protein